RQIARPKMVSQCLIGVSDFPFTGEENENVAGALVDEFIDGAADRGGLVEFITRCLLIDGDEIWPVTGLAARLLEHVVSPWAGTALACPGRIRLGHEWAVAKLDRIGAS